MASPLRIDGRYFSFCSWVPTSRITAAHGVNVSVLQLDARDEDAAAQLLAAARARGESLHYVNVPEGDPASAALRTLGGSIDLRQYELRKAVSR